MRFLKQFIPVVLIAFIGGQVVGAVSGSPVLTLIAGLVTAVLSVLVYRWVVKWAEKRSPVELGVKSAPVGLLLGIAIGFVWFGAVIVNLMFLGDFHISGAGGLAGPVGLLGFMAAACVTEELMFRGVLLRIIQERAGTWIALLVTSVLFGCWHLLNPGATVWGVVAIAIEAGGALGAAYIATRKLWVPIGLHFGWNFAESAIFGTEVSGNGSNQGLLHGVMSGPSMLTGGEFGPEASPYAIVFGVIIAAIFLLIARRKGNWVPLRHSARHAATATLSA